MTYEQQFYSLLYFLPRVITRRQLVRGHAILVEAALHIRRQLQGQRTYLE